MPTVKVVCDKAAKHERWLMLRWIDTPWGGEWEIALRTDDVEYAIHCALYYTMDLRGSLAREA